MNGAEEPIAELAPNRGQRCQLTGHIGHDSPNTEVTVEIYEINGASFDISVSETFSAYYVRNMNSGKSGRAYDLSMDAYTFENSSLSYTEWRNWLWTFKDLDVLRAIGMLITGVTGGLEGRCHGYAATSNRFLMYENEKPVAKETGDMTLSDDGVSELISRYFIRQVYEPEAPYETGMQEAVNKLKFRFAVDEPVMILFTDHTIAAYKLLVREEKDEAYLYFYDSNYPEQARAGIMRWGENNSFEYEEYSKFRDADGGGPADGGPGERSGERGVQQRGVGTSGIRKNFRRRRLTCAYVGGGQYGPYCRISRIRFGSRQYYPRR